MWQRLSIRHRLTAIVLMFIIISAIASVSVAQSAEPQTGTIPRTIPPPSEYIVYFPQVMGSHYTVGVFPTK